MFQLSHVEAVSPAIKGIPKILCKKIFKGNKQGSKLLNENLLAEKYGVSRASLREALKILKSKSEFIKYESAKIAL